MYNIISVKFFYDVMSSSITHYWSVDLKFLILFICYSEYIIQNFKFFCLLQHALSFLLTPVQQNRQTQQSGLHQVEHKPTWQ